VHTKVFVHKPGISSLSATVQLTKITAQTPFHKAKVLLQLTTLKYGCSTAKSSAPYDVHDGHCHAQAQVSHAADAVFQLQLLALKRRLTRVVRLGQQNLNLQQQHDMPVMISFAMCGPCCMDGCIQAYRVELGNIL
jgi:hypothetical protein